MSFQKTVLEVLLLWRSKKKFVHVLVPFWKYVHVNITSWETFNILKESKNLGALRAICPYSNIDEIVCKHINNIFRVHYGNFKTDFFLKFIFSNISYGLSLWHFQWFSWLVSAINLQNFCIKNDFWCIKLYDVKWKSWSLILKVTNEFKWFFNLPKI